jgi:hypothetical protein
VTGFDRAALLLYVSVAVSLGFLDHRVRREQYREHVVTQFVPSVIDGTAGAPAKYRVLSPYALDWLFARTQTDRYLLFLVYELAFIFTALVATHWYLRCWFAPQAALAGTLALATLLPLTFTNSWAHPDTFPDLTLFALGALAVASRRDLLLAVILFVGMFNRETMGFLALLWMVERLRQDRGARTVARAAALCAVCAAVYVGVRWVRGFEHYRMFMLDENLKMLKLLPPGFDPYTRVAGYFWAALLAVPAALAFSGARRAGAAPFFTSALVVAAVYTTVVWLFAAIIETRVLIPVLVLLLPGAVYEFAGSHGPFARRAGEPPMAC